METDGDSPPMWSHSSTTAILQARRRRRRHSPPSLLLNPVVLILIIPILTVLFLFFLIPQFILKPTFSVKTSWDSFSVVLVLFAVLCGVFAKRNDDVMPGGDQRNGNASSSNVLVQNSNSVDQWFDSFSTPVQLPDTVGNRLRRSSVSSPDLRREDLRETGGTRSRFADDLEVNRYRRASSDNSRRRSRRSHVEKDSGVKVKVIPVDKFEVHSAPHPPLSPAPPASSKRRSLQSVPGKDKVEKQMAKTEVEVSESQPAPPPPPPASSKRRSQRSVPREDKVEMQREERQAEVNESQPPPPRPPPPPASSKLRSLESVPRKEKVEMQREKAQFEVDESQSAPLPLPSPPSPPPVPASSDSSEQKNEIYRKKSSKQELATAIATLYNQKKRKMKNKTRDIFNSVTQSPPPPPPLESVIAPATPPPPPPPPPPSKVFQNLFKKSSKNIRVHSVSTSAPPPPPPPNSIFNNLFKTGTKSKRFDSQSSSSAAEAASSPPPPPPPPPPPSSILNTLFKTGSKSSRFKQVDSPPPPPPPPPHELITRKSPPHSPKPIQPPAESSRRRGGKPPLPTKSNSYYDEYLNNYAQSPLLPIPPSPPPPPPPPFKMRDSNFVARGDFVRIRSSQSSQCSSPELEDVDVASTESHDLNAIQGDDLIGPGPVPGPGPNIICPSPDVNVKADNFIARLKDEWRFEMMNSRRENREEIAGLAHLSPNN